MDANVLCRLDKCHNHNINIQVHLHSIALILLGKSSMHMLHNLLPNCCTQLIFRVMQDRNYPQISQLPK